MQDRRLQRIPGDTLLHPLALTAVVLLLLNDHTLKPAAPGIVTGKVSDFAGLVFFPLLLVALVELVRRSAGIPVWSLSLSGRAACVLLTGLTFAIVKEQSVGRQLVFAGPRSLAMAPPCQRGNHQRYSHSGCDPDSSAR
jgi:hypothetical protein